MNKIMIFFLLQLFWTTLRGQSGEVFTTNDGAIGGYDPVAYFQESKPVKGKKEFSYRWNDATWLFSNAQNLKLFKANPQKFAPQYGGYCAYGTAEGHKAPTEPNAWSVVNGKLYLNYNLEVQNLWKKNQIDLIQKADKNWPEVKKQ